MLNPTKSQEDYIYICVASVVSGLLFYQALLPAVRLNMLCATKTERHDTKQTGHWKGLGPQVATSSTSFSALPWTQQTKSRSGQVVAGSLCHARGFIGLPPCSEGMQGGAGPFLRSLNTPKLQRTWKPSVLSHGFLSVVRTL